jgi:hypothetical protein
MSGLFIHNVFFWLHPDASTGDIERFEKGVNSLLKVPGLEKGYISKPAGTRREIIDFSYSYHLLLIFQNEEAHEVYQTTDPVHQKFIADCRHLWYKIQIYDSLN